MHALQLPVPLQLKTVMCLFYFSSVNSDMIASLTQCCLSSTVASEVVCAVLEALGLRFKILRTNLASDEDDAASQASLSAFKEMLITLALRTPVPATGKIDLNEFSIHNTGVP